MANILTGVFWTGGSLNPARSFAPAVVIRSFDSYQGIYWVGPFSGSILAVILLKIIKGLGYYTVNGAEQIKLEGLTSNLVEESMRRAAPAPEGRVASQEILVRNERNEDIDIERQAVKVPGSGRGG